MLSHDPLAPHETTEKGRIVHRLKIYKYNNEHEDKSPNTQINKNYQASSKKFRQKVYKIKTSWLIDQFLRRLYITSVIQVPVGGN